MIFNKKGAEFPMDFVQPIKDQAKIEAMKKVLKTKRLRDYALFVLGINSGLRISDLLALKVEDILTTEGNVSDRITLSGERTGKTQVFPIGPSAREALKEHLAQSALAPTSPLFPSRKGNQGKIRPISREQAYRILNDAAKTVGIKENIGTHTLRKTFAYHAYKNGHDLSMIQKILNHSAPSVTLRYIGITQEEPGDVRFSMDL